MTKIYEVKEIINNSIIKNIDKNSYLNREDAEDSRLHIIQKTKRECGGYEPKIIIIEKEVNIYYL